MLHTRYLFSGEAFDISGTYGPPRLAVVAASVLHHKLITDLGYVSPTPSSCCDAVHGRCDDNIQDDADTCDICFDAAATACTKPCNHYMCGKCVMRVTLHKCACPQYKAVHVAPLVCGHGMHVNP